MNERVKGRSPIMRRGYRRLLWFIGLWAAGVMAVAALAYLIRLILGL